MSSPNDLAGLADLKAWLGITSTTDDLLLAGLITEISVAILADLGRATVRPTIYTETRDGGGEASLVLRHWPVTQVLSFTINAMAVTIAAAPPASPSQVLSAVLDTSDPAPPGRMQRLSLVNGSIPHGLQNVVIAYRAGYEIANEPATVPTSAPYVVSASAPYGLWQSDGAVAYAVGGTLQAASVPAPGAYSVANGTYSFSAADAGAAITLRYGYVPADLARCCREWAADRYAARSRIGQSAKTLGGQETTSFIVKAMPDFVSRVLQPYRRVVGL